MPLDDVLSFPVLTVDAGEFTKLDGAKEGQTGSGTFDFRVMHDEMSGTVQLEIHRLEIETENSADKELVDMKGPATKQVPDEEDDDENDDI